MILLCCLLSIPPSDVEADEVSGGKSRRITVRIPENVREIINSIKSCQVPEFIAVIEPMWTPTVKLSKNLKSKILLDKSLHDEYTYFSGDQFRGEKSWIRLLWRNSYCVISLRNILLIHRLTPPC
jgi:hypothetical protein